MLWLKLIHVSRRGDVIAVYLTNVLGVSNGNQNNVWPNIFVSVVKYYKYRTSVKKWCSEWMLYDDYMSPPNRITHWSIEINLYPSVNAPFPRYIYIYIYIYIHIYIYNGHGIANCLIMYARECYFSTQHSSECIIRSSRQYTLFYFLHDINPFIMFMK